MAVDPQHDAAPRALPTRHSAVPADPLTPIGDFPPFHRFWQYWMRDHASVRVVLPNTYRVDADVWRGGHPGRGQLKRLKAQGIATILNLRGGHDTVSNATERALCAELDLPLLHLGMRATALPRREVLQDLLTLLREVPKPVFLHCKSGADRTALAVTLYLHVIKGQPLAEARRAFSWRYGHIRRGKARPLHQFLDAYAAAQAETGIGFEEWLDRHYDPAALS